MASALSALNINVTELEASKTPILPHQKLSTSILGVQSTVIVQLFADRVFVTVTQLNKFGCLYQAFTSTNPAVHSMHDGFDEDEVTAQMEQNASSFPPPLPSTSISKLVGTEPSPTHAALYELYVSQIASIVKHSAPTDPRPLIVSLALQTTRRKAPADGQKQEEHSDDDEDLLMDAGERERFIGIMSLVQQCVSKVC